MHLSPTSKLGYFKEQNARRLRLSCALFFKLNKKELPVVRNQRVIGCQSLKYKRIA